MASIDIRALAAYLVDSNRQVKCRHCWHVRDPDWKNREPLEPIKNGHIMMECCRCPEQKSVHRDHVREHR
jgi:hypothetical protein